MGWIINKVIMPGMGNINFNQSPILANAIYFFNYREKCLNILSQMFQSMIEHDCLH